MQQLVKPNLTVKGQIGSCLQYARTVFGAPAVEPNAWTAWTKAKFKHADHNIPTDVAVPCWFSYFQNGVNLGHVVISVPGKGFYSSPWKKGTTSAVLPSIAEIERIYDVVYVGWSEDISNVRVVEGEDMFQGKSAHDWFSIALSYDGRIKQLQNALNEANAKLAAANQKPVSVPQKQLAEIDQISTDVSWIKALLSRVFK